MWWFAWTAVRVRPSPLDKKPAYKGWLFLSSGDKHHPPAPPPGGFAVPPWAPVAEGNLEKVNLGGDRRSKNMAFLGLTLRQGCRIRLWRFRKWRSKERRSPDWAKEGPPLSDLWQKWTKRRVEVPETAKRGTTNSSISSINIIKGKR